jgi:hypothetical protein
MHTTDELYSCDALNPSLKNWKRRCDEEGPGKDGEKKWKEIYKCWK